MKQRRTSGATPAEQGRLLARPSSTPSGEPAPSGVHLLPLAAAHEALCYLPRGYRAEQPAPLVVLLHGAGGNAQRGIALLEPLADAAGIILLAPTSHGRTWDVILGSYDPDISALDEALTYVFERYAVDLARLAIGGFSDGASYALSVGLTNGDLWTHIIAFAPGFMAPASQRGTPRVFISHGTRDAVLPIDRCSRRIVPALQAANYDVRYEEFDGPHTVPPAIALQALDWFASPSRTI